MADKCEWVKNDGARCRSYAVEGDYCRMHAKVVAKQTEPETRDVRKRLRADAENAYDAILNAIREAITSETTRWGDCPSCKHRVPVSFPDINARTKALELWLAQGYGKPTERVEVKTEAAPGLGLSSEELRALATRLIEIRPDLVDDLEDGSLRRQHDPIEMNNRRLGYLLVDLEKRAVAALDPRSSIEEEQACRENVRETFVALLQLDSITSEEVLHRAEKLATHDPMDLVLDPEV